MSVLAWELVTDYLQEANCNIPDQLLQGGRDMAALSVAHRRPRNAALRRRGVEFFMKGYRASSEAAEDWVALERRYARIAGEALVNTIEIMGLQRRAARAQREAAVLAQLLERHPELAAEAEQLRGSYVAEG